MHVLARIVHGWGVVRCVLQASNQRPHGVRQVVIGDGCRLDPFAHVPCGSRLPAGTIVAAQTSFKSSRTAAGGRAAKTAAPGAHAQHAPSTALSPAQTAAWQVRMPCHTEACWDCQCCLYCTCSHVSGTDPFARMHSSLTPQHQIGNTLSLGL